MKLKLDCVAEIEAEVDAEVDAEVGRLETKCCEAQHPLWDNAKRYPLLARNSHYSSDMIGWLEL